MFAENGIRAVPESSRPDLVSPGATCYDQSPRASQSAGKESAMGGNGTEGVSRRWRTAALLATGIAIGAMLMGTPVYSHVGGTVAHLWTKHIRAKTDARYYRKAASESRYVNVSEKARSAAHADTATSAGTAANADKLDGIDGTGFYAAGSKVADADKLDGEDVTNFVRGENGFIDWERRQIPVGSSDLLVFDGSRLRIGASCVDKGTEIEARVSFAPAFFGLLNSVRVYAPDSFSLVPGDASEYAWEGVRTFQLYRIFHPLGHGSTGASVLTTLVIALHGASPCEFQAQATTHFGPPETP
jgi:hypothetical protein